LQNFGKQAPMKRPGPPAELVTAHMMLAVFLSSDVSGTTFAVTGGKSILWVPQATVPLLQRQYVSVRFRSGYAERPSSNSSGLG
jgi:hypothetical protein